MSSHPSVPCLVCGARMMRTPVECQLVRRSLESPCASMAARAKADKLVPVNAREGISRGRDTKIQTTQEPIIQANPEGDRESGDSRGTRVT